jgi:hypothetical protein
LWRDAVANVRVHGTTKAVPVQRFRQEPLQPLDRRLDFDTALYTSRRVARDCFVAFEGNRYSVPWRFAGRDLLLRIARERQLQVLWEGEIVARHEIATGRGQVVKDPAHFRGIPKGRPGRPVLHLLARPAPHAVELRPLSVYDEVAGVSSHD